MWIYNRIFWAEQTENTIKEQRCFSLSHFPGLLLNLEKTLTLRCGSSSLQLEENQLIILPPDTGFSLSFSFSVNYIFIALNQNIPGYDILPGHTLSTLHAMIGQKFCVDYPQAGCIRELAGKLIRGHLSNEYGYYAFRSSWISEILVNAISCITPRATADAQNSVIRNVIVYLNENYTEKTSIDMLASRFYLSKYHLMRQFKKETGYTIHLFISNKRVRYACHLIDSGITPGEACYRSGFTDYSLFFKTFKKVLGYSPSHYAALQASQTG